MSEETKITCDGCVADLTYTSNTVDYRLNLSSEPKTPWYIGQGMTGGAMTAMSIRPSITKTKHFCNLNCLQTWLDNPSGNRN